MQIRQNYHLVANSTGIFFLLIHLKHIALIKILL